MGLLLVAAGGLFALLFTLNAVIQTLRRQPRIGFVHLLLAFLAGLVTLAGLLANRLSETPIPLTRTLTWLVAGALIFSGLLLLLVELQRPGRLKGSRGLLGLGVGLLLVVSTLTVPLIGDTLLSSLEVPPTLPVILTAPPRRTPMLPTSAAAMTATPKPPPSPTPFTFTTNTPAPTGASMAVCLATTAYNLNLRAAPNPDAELLFSIAFNTPLRLLARNADSSWWYVEYTNRQGWVKGEFLTFRDSCGDLPLRP